MEVLVEYDYTGEENDELTIKKGDIIKEVTQFEEGWYVGNLNGKIGVFPDNFVKVLDTPNSKLQATAAAEHIKESTTGGNSPVNADYDETKLAKKQIGQRVTGIGLGNIFSGQPIQLKLASLKDVIKETDTNSDKTINNKPTVSNAKDEKVQVRFEYQPKHSDELELRVDDIILIVDKSLPDEGWWKGRNQRTKKTGVFPDNFVVPYTEPNDPIDELPKQPMQTGNPSANNVSATTLNLQRDSTQVSKPSNNTGLYNPTGTDPPRLAPKPSPPNSANPGAKLKQSPTGSAGQFKQNTNTTAGAGQQFGRNGAGINPPGNSMTTGDRVTYGKLVPRSDCAERGSDSERPVQNASSPNQRLTGITSERPRQPGRRLPSKFTRPNGHMQDQPSNPVNDFFGETESAQPRSEHVSPIIQSMQQNELTYVSREPIRVNGNGPRMSESNGTKSQRPLPGNQSKTNQLYRSEGTSGSADLIRSSVEPGVNKQSITPEAHRTQQEQQHPNRLQIQIQQFQSQLNQHMTESKKQVHEMRQQIEHLKQQNSQLRSDMVHNQRNLTERLQFLMNELDESKKQRAADSVELSRLRALCMQLDAKAMMKLTGLDGDDVVTTKPHPYQQPKHHSRQHYLPSRPPISDQTDDDPFLTRESDAQSLYEEGDYQLKDSTPEPLDHYENASHNGDAEHTNTPRQQNYTHNRGAATRNVPILPHRMTHESNGSRA